MTWRMGAASAAACALLVGACSGGDAEDGQTQASGGSAPAASASAGPRVQAASKIEAGRYLVVAGGCNDCHTPGWDMSMGATPEADWLVGTPIGWHGPWGTTYAQNLRLVADSLTEDEFVELLKTRKALPPMPWQNVNRLHEEDARAIHAFIKSLGPKGERMPTTLPPGQVPKGPYYTMVNAPSGPPPTPAAAPPPGAAPATPAAGAPAPA